MTIGLIANNDGTGALQLGGSNAISLDTSLNSTMAGYVNAPNTFGFKNRIINGGMSISQYVAGASVTLSSTVQFPVDRFGAIKDTSAAVATAQQSSTTASGFINSLVWTTSTAATPGASDDNAIRQFIEGLNIADLNWGATAASAGFTAKSITLSFWARSSVTGTYGVSFSNSAVNRCYMATYTINAANTYEYKTITIPGDTAGTWLTTNGIGLRIYWDMGAGASRSIAASSAWGSSYGIGLTGGVKIISNASATFYITGVQVETGTTATSFDFRDYGRELALCQRYYIEVGIRNASGSDVFPLQRWGTNLLGTSFNTPVTMRATPTGTLTGTYSVSGNSGTSSLSAISSVTTVTNTGVAIVYTSSVDPAQVAYVALGSSSNVKTALNAEL